MPMLQYLCYSFHEMLGQVLSQDWPEYDPTGRLMAQEEQVHTFLHQDVCSSLCSGSCDVCCGASNKWPRVLIWCAAAADPGQQAMRAQFGVHLLLQVQP